jgi:hypothetical protein
LSLVVNEFGNYVIQCVLAMEEIPDFKLDIAEILLDNINKLIFNRFAAKSIEKVWFLRKIIHIF